MPKKAKAAPAGDIDNLIDGDAPAKKPAAKKPAAAPAPAAKKAKAKTDAAPAAPAAKKAKAKAKTDAAPAAPAADTPLRKALLKVKKAISYADFAESNDFNIRTVRRAARVMRDAGEIDLTRDGQTVYIRAAV